MPDLLHLRIVTPHATVLDARVSGARIPTETGQAGLRPRQESLVLVVEPGLIVLRIEDHACFAATAGGLLESQENEAVIYTPYAARGDTDAEVLDALRGALAKPDGELSARKRLGELEQRIVRELRQRPPVTRARVANE
jgi:F0F1-type ATP synthase epsilon subunit